jgi:hypothetical protein
MEVYRKEKGLLIQTDLDGIAFTKPVDLDKVFNSSVPPFPQL